MGPVADGPELAQLDADRTTTVLLKGPPPYALLLAEPDPTFKYDWPVIIATS
jgi:hypothetical protein